MSGSYGPPASKRGRYVEVYSPNQPMSPGEVEQLLKTENTRLEENKVVLLLILNAIYPINVEVINKIVSPIADPVRIVIFQKAFLQVMVELKSIEDARRVKEELHRCDIYPDACTIKAEWAKTAKLNVKRNDNMTWDFTENKSSDRHHMAETKSAPEPRKTLMSMPPVMSGGMGMAMPQMSNAPGGGMGMGGMANSNMRGGGGGMSGVMGEGWGGGYNNSADSYSSKQGHSGGGGLFNNPGGSYNNSGGNYNNGGGSYNNSGGGNYNNGSGSYQSGGQSYNNGGRRGGGMSPVVMVYNLDSKFTCQGLFNLLCLYGNVNKISFMRKKEGCAMVEMGDPMAAERVIQNLRKTEAFGKTLSMESSHKPNVDDINRPHELSDGSPSFVNFIGNKLQRFSTEEKAQKNRILAPTTTLHFFNCPLGVSEDQLKDHMIDFGALNYPTSVTFFDAKPGATQRTLSGLMRYASLEDATDAIILANNTRVKSDDPHDLKLCFSSSRD